MDVGWEDIDHGPIPLGEEGSLMTSTGDENRIYEELLEAVWKP